MIRLRAPRTPAHEQPPQTDRGKNAYKSVQRAEQSTCNCARWINEDHDNKPADGNHRDCPPPNPQTKCKSGGDRCGNHEVSVA
jgi:hypothetical protein